MMPPSGWMVAEIKERFPSAEVLPAVGLNSDSRFYCLFSYGGGGVPRDVWSKGGEVDAFGCGQCWYSNPNAGSYLQAEYMKPILLRERLAEVAHQQWSGWMRHLFDRSTFNEDGTVTMSKEDALRWLRQIATPYSELPEEEQESDRKEADKVLAMIEEDLRRAIVR